ncbi:MAG: AMP-dependent synthetase [Rickettsiales bacterium]|nr:AMP-dependent synthetase [Rickettsiales bacterium]
MHINFLLDSFQKNSNKNAIIWNEKVFKYEFLIQSYYFWSDELKKKSIESGNVVVIEGDFSPNAISLLLALINKNAIIVPITETVKSKKEEFIKISQAEVIIEINKEDRTKITHTNNKSDNILYSDLKSRNRPGLVLFSSGSTGKSKGSVHDITYLLNKFKIKRHSLKTITFLLYDHIGGFNTLFYILSNGGTVVTVQSRTPSNVLSLIEKYKVELLPTSPTFLNLILLHEEHKNYDLSSLKIITYGTEPMPKHTLERLNQLFPNIKFTQTYGLSEVGILRSKSKSSNSLWVKVGGEDYQTRIVENLLQIKSKSSMLGYLNAPSPFTSDGWFKTGDYVLQDGEYIKIIGRNSEIINVGGEKVYPQEVEDLLIQHPLVEEALVYGEKNPIIGNIVCAKLKLCNVSDPNKTLNDIKTFCLNNIEKFKVPMKLSFSKSSLYSERFKKKRSF